MPNGFMHSNSSKNAKSTKDISPLCFFIPLIMASTFGANIQNVYTWSKYKGLDPEVGAIYGDALMTGVDYGRYPSPRIYTFGLNISF